MAYIRNDPRRHAKRSTGVLVIGVLLALVTGGLVADSFRRKSSEAPAQEAYDYTVRQSIDKSVSYFQNSFFENGPGNNDGFVMDLTDKINAVLHYNFSASQVQDLTYSYDVKAILRGKYLLAGSEKDASSVWTKEYQLIEPVSQTVRANQLNFSPSVEVPYAEYKEVIEQMRVALALVMESEVKVVFRVSVTGMIGGAKLDDTRESTVTATIGPQIYALVAKVDEKDSKQIVPVATQQGIDRTAQSELYLAVALGVLAAAAFIYGLRKQIFRTPYQRELDRIYRYHDGIIVRAARPTDLTGKQVVVLKSFEDILNLEEGLKLPIVATTIGPEATQFTIMRNDVVYSYTLGTVSRRSETSLEQIEESVSRKIDAVAPPKKRPPRKIQ